MWRDVVPSWVMHDGSAAPPKESRCMLTVTASPMSAVTSAPMTPTAYSKTVATSGVRWMGRVFGEDRDRIHATGHAAIDPGTLNIPMAVGPRSCGILSSGQAY